MRRKLISTLLVATMVMAPVVSVSAAADDAAESTPVKAADAVGITLPEKVEGSYTIGYAPATLNNAFWLAVKDGVQKAID